MRGRRKKPTNLQGLRVQDEALRISRDFMHRLPELLDKIADESPEKAINAWSTITEFAVAKKGKDTPAIPPMNLNINLVPAKRDTPIDIPHIEMKNKEIED